VYDEEGVVRKFGVPPESIPDWLALVGDAADGYPGIRGWGEKSAAAVLARFKHIEAIPREAHGWGVKVSRAAFLADNLQQHRDDASLFRRLATLREDVPIQESLDDLCWRGPRTEFKQLCSDLGTSELVERAQACMR
jgi:5'-3' exonuclease